jgi:hypothetical protein
MNPLTLKSALAADTAKESNIKLINRKNIGLNDQKVKNKATVIHIRLKMWITNDTLP